MGGAVVSTFALHCCPSLIPPQPVWSLHVCVDALQVLCGFSGESQPP